MSSSQSNPGFSQQESHAPPGATEPGSAKARDTSMARNIVGVLCPYCASVSADIRRCNACGGHFDPLSRQATQNDMGPCFLFDKDHPTRPGCAYEKISDLAVSGKIRPGTIIRGPTTKQFWSFASRAPSIANLVGYCHNCQGKAGPDDYSCRSCGSVFSPETDRQHLGLAPVRLLPGRDSPAVIAAREFSPRDLGPEPAVLDAPANPRVLETKPAPTDAKRPAPSVEPKSTRPLPGASFLPPTPEELAELANVSRTPIAPPAKVEIAVPIAKTSASVPTAKARPAPTQATSASTAWDLGSLDNDRGSGGAWWWVAAVAMLALGGGIAYIAWSQSNPGQRYLAKPSTIAKGATPTNAARSDKLAPPLPAAKPVATEPESAEPMTPSVKAEDRGATPALPEPSAGEMSSDVAPASIVEPPTTLDEQGPDDAPEEAPVAAPQAPTPAPILPARVDSAPTTPSIGATPVTPAPPTTIDIQVPPSNSQSAITPGVKPAADSPEQTQTPAESEVPAPEAPPSTVPIDSPSPAPVQPELAVPIKKPAPDPITPGTTGDSLLEIRRQVLTALKRESSGSVGLDSGKLLSAWMDRADGPNSLWLAKVRETLDRWRESDRVGRSLP